MTLEARLRELRKIIGGDLQVGVFVTKDRFEITGCTRLEDEPVTPRRTDYHG